MLKDSKAFSSFSVNDASKVKDFYSDTLGLDVEQDDSMGMTMLHIHLSTGGEILVYPKGDAHEAASYTVLNFPVEDIDKAVEELVEKGVKFEHYDSDQMKTDDKGIARGGGDNPGPSVAWFKDPAGNVLSVMQ